MRHLRSVRMVAAAAALSVGLAACAGTEEDVSEPAQTQAEEDGGTTADDPGGSDDMTEAGDEVRSPDPFAELVVAVQAVGNDGSAKALAGGLDTALGLEGDISSPAAQTYATLSTLLNEHVYLAGIAVDAAYSFGLDSGEFELAANALDGNSVELADVIGSVAPDQRDAFLELWRQHIGFFVDYAKGAAAGDQAMIDQAKADLAGYGEQAGAFFESISGGEIPSDAVQATLEKHVETLGAAIEAAAAGDGTVFDKLKEAADVVGPAGSAQALAAGLDRALNLEGDVSSPAAQTYATLSTLLEEHVLLSGIAVKTAYTAGLDSAAFEAAAATLDSNSVELADFVGTVAPDQRDAFLELWRQHIGFFVDYAKGAAAGDQAVIDQAKADLAGYGEQSGAFFESISGGAIPASAVQDSLATHVDTLGSAIEALAAALV